MHAGTVQDLRRVEVADAGHRGLVQEGDLDRPPAGAQPLAKLVGVTSRASGPIFCGPSCSSNCRGDRSRTTPSPRRSQKISRL